MIEVVKWAALQEPFRFQDAIDVIFFESSGTRSFASDEAREVFKERWLGRYLQHYPQWFYLALDDANAVQGYLAGCLDDPASTALFSDTGYFQDLAPMTARFPGHLHVNLAPSARGKGTGSRLVSAFVKAASAAGCPGLHVVTGRGMRNVGFYARQGFGEEGRIDGTGRSLVFLARALN